MHQKSNSAITRKREKNSVLSVQRSKNPVIGKDTTTIPLSINCHKLCNDLMLSLSKVFQILTSALDRRTQMNETAIP